MGFHFRLRPTCKIFILNQIRNHRQRLQIKFSQTKMFCWFTNLTVPLNHQKKKKNPQGSTAFRVKRVPIFHSPLSSKPPPCEYLIFPVSADWSGGKSSISSLVLPFFILHFLLHLPLFFSTTWKLCIRSLWTNMPPPVSPRVHLMLCHGARDLHTPLPPLFWFRQQFCFAPLLPLFWIFVVSTPSSLWKLPDPVAELEAIFFVPTLPSSSLAEHRDGSLLQQLLSSRPLLVLSLLLVKVYIVSDKSASTNCGFRRLVSWLVS